MKILIKTSSTLNMFWNFGSMIFINMIIQIMLGFILSMQYFFYSNNMFINSFNIYFNINFGWLLRLMHSNMTSMIFILIFIHMIRSIIYKNYINLMMWLSGILMLLLMMMISFLGYSLIFSQMSFWASMVITNFIMVIPLIGNKLMITIWGNYFINNLLLNRFLSLHFIIPMILIIFSLIHLIILHLKKSNNPVSINNNFDLINLSPLFIFKDMLMMILSIYMFLMINFLFPNMMNNFDNFNFMNYFKTPNHIEPEWYFLFFYSILRSINNKLNGLMLMLMSIIMLIIMPMLEKTKFLSNNYFKLKKKMILIFCFIIMIITFLGSKPIEFPYNLFNQIFIFLYFIMFLNLFLINKIINKNLNMSLMTLILEIKILMFMKFKMS